MDEVQASESLSGAELREASFPQARRGYERRAVHAFLDRVADWVEARGGETNADPGLTSELEKVGERTAGILTAAEEAAAKLRRDAKEYADEFRQNAEDETRKTSLNASQKADELISEAETKAEGIIDEAIVRRRRLNQAITSLEERRDEIAEQVAGLADQLLEAVDAIRSEELVEQPEDVRPEDVPEDREDAPGDDPEATPSDSSSLGEPTELEPPDERETTVHETQTRQTI